jgi:hypothetical protein
MKVIRIDVRSLHNEEWFGFYTDYKAQATAAGVEALGISELFALLTPLYDKADRLMVVLQKSVYTQEIEHADKTRDELFRGFYSVVKGSRKQPDSAKQESALRLYNLLRQYHKSVIGGNYVEESSALHNLLQYLNGKYASDIALLALGEWVTAIGNAEEVFLNLRSQRTQESIEKPKEDLRQIRVQTDALYTAMVSVLDAKLLAAGLGGNITFDPDDPDDSDDSGNDGPVEGSGGEQSGNAVYNFVVAWNETVKKYRNLLAQRAGRRNKGNETEITES